MSTQNKELAVSLMKAWLDSYGNKLSNVAAAPMPNPQNIIDSVVYIAKRLDEYDKQS